MFHVITAAIPEPGCKVRLTFSDGTSGLADFAPVAVQGGVFAKLRDPQFFAQVTIGDRGRSIEWPGELDFCADALWQECHQRDAVPANAKAS
ncbi:MAG: DUF2442 domain-containing protein [Planctomycetota bacterium]|nr:DUF2442 domain-containing protein [Planctomycetota bacterium]